MRVSCIKSKTKEAVDTLQVYTKGKLFVGSGEFSSFSIEPQDNNPTKEKQWYIKGIASTGDKDLDGESVDPNGLNIGYFKDYGFINFDHKQAPRDIVGEPLSNSCYVDAEGLHVTALLYKDKPIVQEMWDLSKSMKNADSQRNLGFSIEGYITSRDPNDNTKITGLKVLNVAITTHPANPEATWESFEKSFKDHLDKDYETGFPANPENLDQHSGVLSISNLADSISCLTSAIRRDNFKDLFRDTEKELLARGTLDNTTKCVLLQLGAGIGRNDAIKFINEGDKI